MKRRFLFGKNWFFENLKLPTEPPTSTSRAIAKGGDEDLASSTWGVVIEKEIYSGKSKFQKIEIFETKEFGRILALDGFVQLSTKHEHVYHEMLVHPAFLYHQKPEKVLIIGGGDGGVLREAVKHPVKEVCLVDIDKKVIEVSKKYLPSVSKSAFKDKRAKRINSLLPPSLRLGRLKIFNEDALKFVKKYNNFFDVIIDDLTDPTGPSLGLWGTGFYRDILRSLKGNGVAAFQTAYLKERFAKKARKRIKKVFPFFKVHKAFVGCFPFDEHTFSFGSKKINFDKVTFKELNQKFKKLNLKTKYYSPEIHFASQVLPQYLSL